MKPSPPLLAPPAAVEEISCSSRTGDATGMQEPLSARALQVPMPLCHFVILFPRSQNNAALYSQCFKESLCTDSSSFVIPVTLPTPTQELGPSLLFSTCAYVLSHFSHVQLFATPEGCGPSGSSVHGDSPGKNTGVDCHVLLQGIFPTQGSNPGLLHCRQILYQLSYLRALGGKVGILCNVCP